MYNEENIRKGQALNLALNMLNKEQYFLTIKGKEKIKAVIEVAKEIYTELKKDYWS